MSKLLVVALPLNLNNTYDYLPPIDYDIENIDELIGKRVVVNILNKLLTGVVIDTKIYNKTTNKLVTKKNEKSYNYKNVINVLDEKPIFSKESIKLLNWVSSYYMAPIGEVYKTAFPLGLSKSSTFSYSINSDYETILKETKVQIDLDDIYILHSLVEKIGLKKSFNLKSEILKKESIKFSNKTLKKFLDLGLFIENEKLNQKEVKHFNVYYFAIDIKDIDTLELINLSLKRSKAQLKLFHFLLDEHDNNGLNFFSEDFLNSHNIDKSKVNSLIEKEILHKRKATDEEVNLIKNGYDKKVNSRKNELNFPLNQEQSIAYDAIKSDINTNKTYLLYGVTGSGKTLIYLKLIQDLIDNFIINNQKKRVLLLLPEISLTPQMIDRFEVAFPGRIAVLHSKLSDNERYETWMNISNSKFDIIIGVRSAVFAPINDLGLIIVDEEHDSSYKQENSTNNYQARDVAIMRGKLDNCLVLLGSATPSIESYYNAINHKYELVTIPNRNDGAKLPDFIVIDKQETERSGQSQGLFSKILIEKISETAQKGEQVILFLNRRGYAPVLECSSCGNTESCPNCEIKLTYHKKSPHFQCHCCGFTLENIKKCTYCNHDDFKLIGFGTQRIEEDLVTILNQKVSQIKAIRLDADTGNTENKLKTIIDDFEKQKYNVLIGTQMISKGLDFENVTLIGLLNPDLSLQFNDFRAAERTYQILTQVSGRAGRSSEKKGRVVIQTKNRNHYSVKSVIENTPELYYNSELNLRENTNYPPFFRIYKIDFKSKDELMVMSAAKLFYKLLPKSDDNLIIYMPVTPVIGYIANTHRKHLIIKVNKNWDKSGNKINKLITDKLEEFHTKFTYTNLKIKVDVDAYNLIV